MSIRTLNLRAGRDRSITLTVPGRTALPIDTLKKVKLAKSAEGEWVLSKDTPIAAGYGRSLRAAILGLPYKSARRLSGNRNSFLHENFQDPSAPR